LTTAQKRAGAEAAAAEASRQEAAEFSEQVGAARAAAAEARATLATARTQTAAAEKLLAAAEKQAEEAKEEASRLRAELEAEANLRAREGEELNREARRLEASVEKLRQQLEVRGQRLEKWWSCWTFVQLALQGLHCRVSVCQLKFEFRNHLIEAGLLRLLRRDHSRLVNMSADFPTAGPYAPSALALLLLPSCVLRPRHLHAVSPIT